MNLANLWPWKAGTNSGGIIPEQDPQGADPTSPQSQANDPLGLARQAAYNVEPVHAKSGGWLPSWKFVPPPGVGDAPQHVWTTFTLIPLSVDGPGDRPATYFRSLQPPVIANFAMRWQGMPVDGGSMLLTGLYAPQPMQSMNSDIYGGL